MKFSKKILIIIIWILLLNVVVMFFYTDVKDIKNIINFKLKYLRRTVFETTLNYKDISQNNVISSNNFSAELSSLNYDKENNKIDIYFKFYTDKMPVNYADCIIAVYDSKRLFCFEEYLNESKITKYLAKKNPYKNLDRSYIETTDRYIDYSISGTYDGLCIELPLEENYNVQDKLNIDFWDLSYSTVDFFTPHKVIKPLGEFRFVVDFNE